MNVLKNYKNSINYEGVYVVLFNEGNSKGWQAGFGFNSHKATKEVSFRLDDPIRLSLKLYNKSASAHNSINRYLLNATIQGHSIQLKICKIINGLLEIVHSFESPSEIRDFVNTLQE